jgi:hypothetical protein
LKFCQKKVVPNETKDGGLIRDGRHARKPSFYFPIFHSKQTNKEKENVEMHFLVSCSPD